MTTWLAAFAGMSTVAGVLALPTAIRGGLPEVRHARPPSRLQLMVQSPSWTGRRNRLLAGLGAAPVVFLATGWPVATVAVAAGIYAIPPMLSGRKPQRRIARLEALAQWSRRLAEMIGASRGLEQALADSARVAPEAIHAPVTVLAERLNNHANTEQALRAFADELDDPIGDLIVCALVLAARRRGQGTREALGLLADAVEQEVLVRRNVEAERAGLRTTLIVIVASVAALSVLFAGSQTLAAPYGTPVGQMVLAMVAALYGCGLWWMRRMAVLSTGTRFLLKDGGFAKAEGSIGSNPRVGGG